MTKALATAAVLAAITASTTLAAPVSGQGTWETTLQARDIDGDSTVDAYYDTVLKITWLANANVNGPMTWPDAMAWAAGLNVHGTTGWRLPSMIDTGAPGCDGSYGGTDCGYNVQTISADGLTVYSEMAHLYHVTLGNRSWCDTSGDCSAGNASTPPDYMLTNTGPFANLQPWAYWSGVAYAPYPADVAWLFVTFDGGQCYFGQDGGVYAMAVRPGDVIAAVPEPSAYVLMLAGWGAMTLIMRRRRSR